MLSHKALAARLRLLRKEGVTEYQEGDFRVFIGRPPGDEQPRLAMPAYVDPEKIKNDPESSADLVLNPPAIDYTVS